MSTRQGRKRAGNERAVWPTETMVQIEKQIGTPVIDWLEAAIPEHRSLNAAFQALADLVPTIPSERFPVRPETIREWWRIACYLDPYLLVRVHIAKAENNAAARLKREADEAERRAAEAEGQQIHNGVHGVCCKVCGAPLPAKKKTTCDSDCHRLWFESRYNIDEEEWEKHRVIMALRAIERSDEPTHLNYARKVISGGPINLRGRWVTSEKQYQNLREVMERRAKAKAEWGDLAKDLPDPPALERGVVTGKSR